VELIDFIRAQCGSALEMIQRSLEDLDDEIVQWQPGGTANTIGQILAHVVSGQDLLIGDKLKGGTALHVQGWAAKSGIPEDRTQIWVKDAWRLDLEGFRAYHAAVDAQSRAYIESMTPADLDREVAWIRGPEQPVSRLFQVIFINHALGHCGEMSALKGIRGLKGLPI
jgi:uncharacterized damage-inducible protein DinB